MVRVRTLCCSCSLSWVMDVGSTSSACSSVSACVVDGVVESGMFEVMSGILIDEADCDVLWWERRRCAFAYPPRRAGISSLSLAQKSLRSFYLCVEQKDVLIEFMCGRK